MGNFNKTLQDGGVVNKAKTSTSANSTSVNSNKFFKPLIASSLALALGVNMVSAIELSLPSTPSNTITEWNFIWNGVSNSPAGGDQLKVYQPYISGNNLAIETLVFKFANSNSGNLSGTEYTATSIDNSIIIKDGGSGNSGGKAIQMGDGNGTLEICFDTNAGKNFILDLSNTENTLQYSFIGNIKVTRDGIDKDGRGNYQGDRYFKAIFGKSVKGDITLESGGKNKDSNPALTFNNGAQLEGNLTVGYEDTKIVFNGDGGSITGDVKKTTSGSLEIVFDTTYSGSIGGDFTLTDQFYQNTIISNLATIGGNITTTGWKNARFDFNASTAKIDGNINVESDNQSGVGAYNTINFGNTTSESKATINGNIQSRANSSGVSSARNTINFNGAGTNTINGTITAISIMSKDKNANNVINFTSTTGTNIIDGLIQAKEDGYGWDAKNQITFSGTNNTIRNTNDLGGKGNVITSDGGTTNTVIFNGSNATKNEIIGNIYSTGTSFKEKTSYSATNDISFTGKATRNTIRGNITAERSGFSASENKISFANTEVSGNNFIEGNITAIGATNTISFSGNANSTIEGNIYANGSAFVSDGLNTIAFNSTGTNTIKGNIEANPYGNSKGSNEITFTNGINTITGNILSKYNNSSASSNTIISNGSSAGLTIDGTITANAGNNTITLSTGSNTIQQITASGGKNTIIVNGSASKLEITNNISASSGTNSIESSAGRNILGGNISNTGGNNFFVFNGTSSLENQIQGDITAGGAKNIIAIASTGSRNTFQTSNSKAIALTAKGSGVAVGQNIIEIKDTTASNTLNFSSISLYNDNNNNSQGQSAQNILSLDGTTTLTVGSISTTTAGKNSNNNNKNIIARNILTKNVDTVSNVGINADLTTNNYLSDTYAFVGSFKVSEGIFASKGENIISFKAASNVNSTIISNTAQANDGSTTFETAISGSNTIYLNIAESNIDAGVGAIASFLSNFNYETLASKAAIAGDIIATGATNIKIVGTPNTETSTHGVTSSTITNKNQIGLLGNIISSSDANIVFQDTFFAPSEMIVTGSDGSTKTSVSAGGEKAGNITTTGGTTNIVTRFSVNPVPTGTSFYNINNQGGTTNIVLQGNLDLGTHLDYAKGSTINLIFANANDGKIDTFEGNSITDLSGNSSKVLGVTYQDGVKLAIADKTVLIGDSETSFLDTYSSYYSDGSTPLATVWANRTNTRDTVAIEGLVVGDIYSLVSSSVAGTKKTYDVTLKSGSAFAGKIKLDASSTAAINIVMEENSKLILSDSQDGSGTNTFLVSTLNIKDGSVDPYQLQMETLKQTNNVINLATGGASANNVAEREDFRLLVVGNTDTSTDSSTDQANTGLQGTGTAVFMTYVNTNANQDKATLGGVASSSNTITRTTRNTTSNGTYGNIYSDRIIIANIGDNSQAQTGTYYMQFAIDTNSKLGSITYNASNDQTSGGGVKTAGNIAVLTVVNTGKEGEEKTAGITLKTQDVLQGFDRIGGDLIAVETDITGEAGTGKTGYTTYFINNLITRGATEATQEVTASAFATNYDLYLANFNSLNKRMGELRDNDNSQGVWARVFSGAQSNDFSKSKSTYTTIQGGYDYALGMEGANNYIGLAVAYSMSSSKSDLNAIDDNGSIKGIEDIKSSAVEVAVYNSYVQDEGWYNDTIAKFSYIMSDFKMTGQTSNYSTNNMAFTLSDEFGYRFKLGEAKEWYIDPQLEVAFGYFNQSDFVQTLGLSTLDGVADGIYTTRARFGSSFGYDFKKFTENKPIKASVYVGAFYEYDYIAGGDVTLTTNLGGETISSSTISSDGRVVMNVGTNMTIKENTRIYFDFETSFAGKIRTDYQANVGVRYSFGENTGYTPVDPNKKSITPLKVSDENASEKEEVENTQENTENTSSESTSETTTEQNTNSTENTTEEKAQ